MRAALLIAFVALPLSARAEGNGLQIGLVSAYSVPSGILPGFVPIAVEAGYRLGPALYLGAFGEYGAGVGPGSALLGSSHTAAAGLALRYRFAADQRMTPWMGLAAGYYWIAAPGVTGLDGQGTSGFEFARVSLGLDYFVSKDVAIGPVASLTTGSFLAARSNGGVAVIEEDAHGWLQAGVQVSFLP